MSTEQIEALESALRDSHAREIEQEHALRALTADLAIAKAEAEEWRAQAHAGGSSPALRRSLSLVAGAIETLITASVVCEADLVAVGDLGLSERFTKLRLLLTRALVATEKKLSDGE